MPRVTAPAITQKLVLLLALSFSFGMVQIPQSASAQVDGQPIPMGPGGLGKKEGDVCYSGGCKICKIDSDGACLDCSDDPICPKPPDAAPPPEEDPK